MKFNIPCIYRSSDFRPLYFHLHELRVFVPSGVPMLAATATVTDVIRHDIIHQLDMDGRKIISVSPNKSNIFYSVHKQTTLCRFLITCQLMRLKRSM